MRRVKAPGQTRGAGKWEALISWVADCPDEWKPITFLNGRLRSKAKAMGVRLEADARAAAAQERERTDARRFDRARQRLERAQEVNLRRQPARRAKDNHVHGATYRGDDAAAAGLDGDDMDDGAVEAAAATSGGAEEGTGASGDASAAFVPVDVDDYMEMESSEGSDVDMASDASYDSGDEEWLPEDFVDED